MEDAYNLIEELREKVRQVISLNNDIRDENNRLKERIRELETTINEQLLTINQSEDKLSNLTITGSLEKGKDNKEVKERIDEIIREIDKCVGMLNA